MTDPNAQYPPQQYQQQQYQQQPAGQQFYAGQVPVAPQPPKKKGKGLKVAGGVVGALIVVSAIGNAMGGKGTATTPAPVAAVTSTTTQTTTTTSSTTTTAPAVSSTTTTQAPVATTTTTKTTTTSAPPAAPALTGPQELAAESARRYLEFKGFSRAGLIQQLSSEYGEGFDIKDATVAVDSLTVDWNAEAAESAQSYLDFKPFSCSGLIQQLSSKYGDQFTKAQATYGAKQTKACK